MFYLRILFIILIIYSNKISANEIKCGLSYDLMEIIATIERHHERAIGYPYLISFNESIDYKNILRGYEFISIDSRTLDCKNRNTCVKILNFLDFKGIKNLDLGAFQVNYVYHKFDKNEYFILENSYQRACTYLESLIQKHGYSWQTIARYHSSTPYFNLKYQEEIAKVIFANNQIKKEKYFEN